MRGPGALGPLVLVAVIALGAAACYLPALRDARAGRERRRSADVLLGLGALLASADLGYAEQAFHLLGPQWMQHFLLLSVFHGLVARALGSRLLLSFALTAFAAWFGGDALFSYFLPLARAHVAETGWRFIACALACAGLRALSVRQSATPRGFVEVCEGFAVHLACGGAFLLTLPGFFDRPLPLALFWPGGLVFATVVALLAALGLRRGQAGLVLTALAYATLGALRLAFRLIDEPLPLAVTSLALLVAAGLVSKRLAVKFRKAP
jgi:hypothetical protein